MASEQVDMEDLGVGVQKSVALVKGTTRFLRFTAPTTGRWLIRVACDSRYYQTYYDIDGWGGIDFDRFRMVRMNSELITMPVEAGSAIAIEVGGTDAPCDAVVQATPVDVVTHIAWGLTRTRFGRETVTFGLNAYNEAGDLQVRSLSANPGAGNKAIVKSAFSPDGQLLVTVDEDGRLTGINPLTGQQLFATPTGVTGDQEIHITPAKDRIFRITPRAVVVTNLADLQSTVVYESATDITASAAYFAWNDICLGFADGRMGVFDSDTFAPKHLYKDHDAPVTGLIAAEGKAYGSGSSDGLVVFYEGDGTESHRVSFSRGVQTMITGPGRWYLFAVLDNGEVVMFDPEDPDPVGTMYHTGIGNFDNLTFNRAFDGNGLFGAGPGALAEFYLNDADETIYFSFLPDIPDGTRGEVHGAAAGITSIPR